jgi:hypothetical protein
MSTDKQKIAQEWFDSLEDQTVKAIVQTLLEQSKQQGYNEGLEIGKKTARLESEKKIREEERKRILGEVEGLSPSFKILTDDEADCFNDAKSQALKIINKQ